MKNSNKILMFIGLFLAILILFSCGTIKKDKTSTELEQKESINSSSNSLKYTSSDKFLFEPFDPTKPIEFENEKGVIERYYNTKIIKENTNTIEQKKDTASEKKDIKLNVDKKIKETDNSKIYLYLFVFGFLFLFLVVMAILIFLFIYLKK